MKYLYAAFIVLLIVSCQSEEKVKVLDRTKTDWAFYKLKGNVKSVSDKSYAVLNENLDKGATKRDGASSRDFEYQFNDEGMLILEKHLGSAGDVLEETKSLGREKVLEKTQMISGVPAVKIAYTWDKSGKDNTLVTRKNQDNSLLYKFETKYKDHKPIEKISYDGQEIVTERITYSYDTKGNVAEETMLSTDGMVLYKSKYGYDADGNKISETRYDRDSRILYQTLYNYKNGRLASEETFNAKGEIDFSKKFIYDNKGNVLKLGVFEKFDATRTIEENTYDAAGNKLTWKLSKNNEPVANVSYKYDKNNSLIDWRFTDHKNNISEHKSYKYEYDKEGNMIKAITYHNGKPMFINERQIIYFGSDE